MKEDIKCEIIGNVKVCIDRNSKTPFQQSKEIYTIVRENNDYELQFSNNCKTQGLSCFSTSLKNLSIYFSIYLLAAVVINLLHELFHFLMFYMAGEQTSGFNFGFSMGSTFIEDMPSIESHSIGWWYLAIMGPLLFVNFFSILIVYLVYKPSDRSYKIFKVDNPYSERMIQVFLHAIAYLSAISILTNTIMSPLMELFSLQADDFQIRSDFTWAWEMSTEMSTEIYHLSEYYVWIVVIVSLLLIALMFKSHFRMRNLAIALFIITISSVVFFFTGISDRNFFQWLLISSVTLEIVFSMIFVFRFGRKVE